MSYFNEINENMLNGNAMASIDAVVPLYANPNRQIDMSGNLITVKTQCGSIYCFDNISYIPLFYNYTRIYNITSDSSGNTIYVNHYGNNDITIYRLNLQGIITSGNQNIILHDSSGNNTTTSPTTTYTDNTNSVSIFTGSIIRQKIIEQDDVCPIKQEQIEDCDIYMHCNCCNKNFFEEEIRHWLLLKSVENRTCPNCRSHWSNYDMYINRI